MADYPDWVQLVQILAGVVQATIDTSGGPVETTINTAGGPVAMTVTNNSLSVKTAAGDTVTVAGTIDANISGSSVTIDTNSTILNEYISSSSIVKVYENTSIQIANLANGSSVTQFPFFNMGLYDGFIILIDSQGGHVYGNNGFESLVHNIPNNKAIGIGLTTQSGPPPSGGFQYIYITAPYPIATNQITFNLVNNTGATIVSDTASVTVYGIKANVNVVNPNTAPVNTQPVNGSPTASNVVNTTGGATTPLISSGGVIKKIYIGACASGGTFPTPCTLHVINGSSNVAEFDVSGMAQNQWKTFELDFGDGVANSGISVYYGANATPPNGQATGYAVMQ